MPKTKQKRNIRAKLLPTTRIAVLVIEDNKILLVKHRKSSRQYWVLPGGRLEYGETFIDCGVRELKEETGLDIRIEDFLFLSEAIAPDRSRHIVNIYLKGKVIGGTMRLGDEPVLAGVDFIPLSELDKITLYPPIAKAILAYLSNGPREGIQYLGNLWV